MLVRVPEGGWKVIYNIAQRWVKNNRDPDNVSFGAATYQHDVLNHDDTVYLLALAFANDAFYGIEYPQEFWQLQIPSDEDELVLRWKDLAQALPILPHATKDKGVLTQPLPRKTFDRILQSVLTASGFYGSVTIHVIRRFLGKKVNGKHAVIHSLYAFANKRRKVYRS